MKYCLVEKSLIWNMTINNKIEVLVTTKNPYNTIKQLKRFKINIYKITYNKDSISIIIDYINYKTIKKYYQTNIIRYIGHINYISTIKSLKYNLFLTIIIILSIICITKITISIEILTNNKELQDILYNELDKNNLTKYTIIKKDKELTNIKNTILNNHKDKLEWLNIKRIGMKYIINLEPKIVSPPNIEEPFCHIISTKDATITKIYSSSGVELKEINESVHKDDILISGEITSNEEIKGHTCAKGTAYGTTWYTISIEIPKYYEKKELKDKTRYNLLLKHNNSNHRLLKIPFNNYISKNKKIINIFGYVFYLEKVIEAQNIKLQYNETELNNKIDELIEEKMKNTLSGEYQIKDKKVLKKVDNNSTIYLEVFIVAEEQISKTIIPTDNTIEEG